MTERQNYSSGASWENIVGYSRAVRIGNVIEVSGTTSIDENGVVHPGNAGMQTKVILEKILEAISALGAERKDVVRTRIYVTDISEWEEIGRMHGSFFSDVKPATTMVEVKSLIDPQMIVEIEATAIIPV